VWTPRGQTPALDYNFNWKSLLAVAGLKMRNLYFRIYAGSVKSPQVVEFLEALGRHIDGPLLVVWDGLPALRSRLVRDHMRGASRSNACPATRRNSIGSSTSGATGSNANWPTSARKTIGNSARLRETACTVGAAAGAGSRLTGSSLRCVWNDSVLGGSKQER
jgi:hypothetical protein